MNKIISLFFLFIFTTSVFSNTERLEGKLERNLENLMEKVVEWRHDIHQYPELSNREFKTAAKVAKHLNNLGLEVKTDIAYTGCLLYTSPSPRDGLLSRMPSSA